MIRINERLVSVVILLSVATLVLLSGCPQRQPAPPVAPVPQRPVVEKQPFTVKIGYQPTEIYQHFFIAKEKGFFDDEGVTVEAVKFASANEMAEALIGGQIHGTATSAFPVIFTVEQNSPGQFKIYLVNAITPKAFPDYILVRKDSKIKKLGDLKGKKIGAHPGSTIMVYTKLILDDYLDPEKDITIVQLKPDVQIEALETGQVDALFSLQPTPAVALTKGLAKVLVEAPLVKHVMDPLPGSASAFSPKFVQEHPELAEKVKNAMYMAVDYIRDEGHTEEVKQVIAKWTPIEPEVIERLERLEYWKVGEIDREAVQKLADLLYKHGALEKEVDTSGLYYEPAGAPSTGQK